MRLLVSAVIACALSTNLAASAFVEKIVFASNRGGADFDIYMMDPDGQHVEPLVAKPHNQVRPDVSPDGRTLSYWEYSEQPGANRPVWRLVFRDLVSGGEAYTFCDIEPMSLKWLRDSSGVIASMNFENQWDCNHVVTSFNERLRLIRRDGSASFVTPNLGDRELIWGQLSSTNEVVYACTHCAVGGGTVKALSLTDLTERIVIPRDETPRGSDGDVSPNGTVFAYAVATCWPEVPDCSWRPSRIWLIGHGGLNHHQISSDSPVVDGVPRFSPDGEWIVFNRTDWRAGGTVGEDVGIRIVRADRSEERELIPPIRQNLTPVWVRIRSCEYGPGDVIVTRTTGAPVVSTTEWESCGGAGEMTIDTRGVAAAVFTVNGVVVLREYDLSAKDHHAVISVDLINGVNRLDVELRSAPGSTLTARFTERIN